MVLDVTVLSKAIASFSDLPILVDIIDWHAISDEFRQAIKSQCVDI